MHEHQPLQNNIGVGELIIVNQSYKNMYGSNLFLGKNKAFREKNCFGFPDFNWLLSLRGEGEFSGNEM